MVIIVMVVIYGVRNRDRGVRPGGCDSNNTGGHGRSDGCHGGSDARENGGYVRSKDTGMGRVSLWPVKQIYLCLHLCIMY